MNTFESDKLFIANTYNRFPIDIVKGKGSILVDNNGKEYIDMGSGIGVSSFGINDDTWTNAVVGQLNKIAHTSNLYYSEPCVALAEKLCQKTGMKKVFFANSGAEANECAVKVVRKYAVEKKGAQYCNIITLTNSFHGRTLTTLAATGQDSFHRLYAPLTPGFLYADVGDMYELEAMLSRHKVAAIMIECVQGEGGVNVLDKTYVSELNKFIKERDLLLVVDEVQTGNGRTGEFYAYMNYGLSPDVVTTAKGLGGGLPIGACLMNDKLKDVFGYGDHGSTFGGNPAVCAGAITIVDRIESLLPEVREKGKYVMDELTGAKGVENVSGLGLMIGIKTTRPVKEVLDDCIAEGVLCLTAKDKLRLLPALNIPFDVLKKAVDVIKKVCAK